MSPRHDPESFFEMPSHDGTGYVDSADLAHELDRRDDSDACAVYAAGDDE